MEVDIQDVPIPVEYVEEMAFYLREDIDPFYIRRQEEGAGSGQAELGFGVENLELFDGAGTRLVCDEVTVLSKYVA